jgi:hypothetical protein
MEKYICKIDGKEFTEYNDLLDYIQNTYVDVVVITDKDENGLNVESIYKKFKRVMPEYVNIRVNKDNDLDRYLVNIDSNICNFSFYIGYSEWEYYHNVFINVEDAIKYYQEFFKTADKIIEKVEQEYKLKLSVNQLWESPGEGGRSIHFVFDLNGSEVGVYYDFDCDIDEFMDVFKQYTENVLEGKLEKNNKGYYTEYKIGGVSIDGFINRSKRVRLEILE